MMKKKAEDERVKAEEEKKKKEEEKRIFRQQQATLAVLQVLQQLSSATPENFESLKKDLDRVLASELPETGSQQEVLKQEAQRVRDYAQQYVEQTVEQRKKLEELRIQQEAKRKEQEKVARALLEELENLVVATEAASENVHYTAQPLAGDNELEDAQVLLLARNVET